MKGHPTLIQKLMICIKNLFTQISQHGHCKSRAYRVHEYFNQKCNIAQAFDILINNKGIRDLPTH